MNTYLKNIYQDKDAKGNTLLYHGSHYHTVPLKPAYLHTKRIVRFDKVESNKFLFATIDKNDAILLGIASSVEKEYGLRKFHIEQHDEAIKITFETKHPLTLKDLKDLEVYVYTIPLLEEDHWVQTNNPFNKYGEYEYKTDNVIEHIQLIEKVDILPYLKARDIEINVRQLVDHHYISTQLNLSKESITMPTPAIKKYAEQSGKTVEEVEKMWEEAVEQADKKFKGDGKNDRYWAYVNAIVRRRLGLSKKKKNKSKEAYGETYDILNEYFIYQDLVHSATKDLEKAEEKLQECISFYNKVHRAETLRETRTISETAYKLLSIEHHRLCKVLNVPQVYNALEDSNEEDRLQRLKTAAINFIKKVFMFILHVLNMVYQYLLKVLKIKRLVFTRVMEYQKRMTQLTSALREEDIRQKELAASKNPIRNRNLLNRFIGINDQSDWKLITDILKDYGNFNNNVFNLSSKVIHSGLSHLTVVKDISSSSSIIKCLDEIDLALNEFGKMMTSFGRFHIETSINQSSELKKYFLGVSVIGQHISIVLPNIKIYKIHREIERGETGAETEKLEQSISNTHFSFVARTTNDVIAALPPPKFNELQTLLSICVNDVKRNYPKYDTYVKDVAAWIKRIEVSNAILQDSKEVSGIDKANLDNLMLVSRLSTSISKHTGLFVQNLDVELTKTFMYIIDISLDYYE